MNLFRSEEHIRNWLGFKPGTEDGIVPLDHLVSLFSLDMFRKRMDLDYVTHNSEYAGGFFSAVADIAKTKPFWVA